MVNRREGGGPMGFMWIGWLLLIVFAGVAIGLLIRGRTERQGRPESPEEILKRRFASGEIDREEYERRLMELRK
jgi:putative membrane protein